MHHARAALLSVGDELTLGQTLDTNSKRLSQALLRHAIPTVEHTTVPDDLDLLARAISRLASRADLLITTGGLGPTADDLTRQALALASDDTLVEDAQARQDIARFFAQRRVPMRPINAVQAQRPSRARCLPNPLGTAPGLATTIRLPDHACDVFCLPGPPREMLPMLEAHVLPALRPTPGRTILTRSIHCVAIAESELASRLGPLMDRCHIPLVGTTASDGVVSIRLRYDGPLPSDRARRLLDDAADAAQRLAGPGAFATDDTTLPHALVSSLTQRRESLALAESCTGGAIASLLTDVPGSSNAFSSAWVTYSTHAKSRDLGVPPSLFEPGAPGAYSAECAIAMASGARRRADATWALATTGVAGPDGGTPDHPVGHVWIALAHAHHPPDARLFHFTGDRSSIRTWAAKSALALLWVHLVGSPNLRLLRQA